MASVKLLCAIKSKAVGITILVATLHGFSSCINNVVARAFA